MPEVALTHRTLSRSDDNSPPAELCVPARIPVSQQIPEAQHLCGLQPDFGEQVQNIE